MRPRSRLAASLGHRSAAGVRRAALTLGGLGLLMAAMLAAVV